MESVRDSQSQIRVFLIILILCSKPNNDGIFNSIQKLHHPNVSEYFMDLGDGGDDLTKQERSTVNRINDLFTSKLYRHRNQII